LTRLGTIILFAACLGLSACGGRTPTGPTPTPTPAPTLSRTRFLAFGDSITLGEVTVPINGLPPAEIGGVPSLRLIVVPAASYPSQLQAQLAARYPSQSASIAVVNAGVGGEHAHEGAARFAQVFGAAQPQAVLLMEGLNDLVMYGSDLPTLALREMTVEARGRGARVFLANMLPSRAGGRLTQSAANLELMNAKLKAMALEEGSVLVNLYDALLPEANTVIGVDGLHPTEAGYRRIADVFLAAIRAELEVK